jgi:hypothetical protein
MDKRQGENIYFYSFNPDNIYKLIKSERNMETKYCLINNLHGLVSGCNYGSEEKAREAIPSSNIPATHAEVFLMRMEFVNDRFIHPENYTNNDKSNKKPRDFALR